MTEERARVEHLIAGLERIEELVVEFRSAITEAVGDLDQLGKAAFATAGKPGVEQVMAGLSVDGLYGVVRQRLHAVGLEVLLQRTSQGAPDDWVADVAERLRRIVA